MAGVAVPRPPLGSKKKLAKRNTRNNISAAYLAWLSWQHAVVNKNIYSVPAVFIYTVYTHHYMNMMHYLSESHT